MGFSKEVLLKQREIAMRKGYLTNGERETFERYIGQSEETNPTHLKTTRDNSNQNRSTRKKTSNTVSKVYDVVSKTPVDEYVPMGGHEVEGYQIDKESTIEKSGGISQMVMYGLGAFILIGFLGN